MYQFWSKFIKNATVRVRTDGQIQTCTDANWFLAKRSNCIAIIIFLHHQHGSTNKDSNTMSGYCHNTLSVCLSSESSEIRIVRFLLK